MSSLIILVSFSVVSFCAGIAMSNLVQLDWAIGAIVPSQAPVSTTMDAKRRERVEIFFGGDPDRDIRGGQEMRPR